MSSELAPRLQHTNVRPEATRADIERLLAECLEHGFDGAMVNPIWVPLAVDVLRGSSVQVCTALDFPMGGGTTASVAAAALEVRSLGAEQIDVMTRPGWLRSGMEADYRDHVAAVVAAADGAPVKAMLEAGLLSDGEVERAVELCVDAGVAWIKNSSGFGGGDATPELVARLHALAAGRVRVKASGGIRTAEAARALIDAGAELLGSSASVAIATGAGTAEPGAY
ncbi:MAG TPA: deoxyribose-phosphate aldolase [Actinomycetota bacterium]